MMAATEASAAAVMILTSVAMLGGGGYSNLLWLWRAMACSNVQHRVGQQWHRAAIFSWSLLLAGGGGGEKGRWQKSLWSLGASNRIQIFDTNTFVCRSYFCHCRDHVLDGAKLFLPLPGSGFGRCKAY